MSGETSEKSGKIKPWPIYACGAFGVGLLVGWGACWLLQYLQARGEKIDQSALATFAAGLMAVGAALFIGVKQIAIQERQTNIQLLNRRYEVIERLLTFQRNHLSPHNPIPDHEWHLVSDALTQSRILFPEKVTDLFFKCLQNSLYSKSDMEISKDMRRIGYPEDALKHQKLSQDILKELSADMDALLTSMIAHARIDL